MAEIFDGITINYSLTYDASPIAHRYMMACPSHLRRRRMTRLIPHACETVMRTMQLGGRMYSGGTLNTAEFATAENSEEASKWRSIPFHLTISKEITPFFYEAIKDRSLDHCKQVINAALEAYVLTVGATTSPPDQVQPFPPAYDGRGGDAVGGIHAATANPSAEAAQVTDAPSSPSGVSTTDQGGTEPEQSVAAPITRESIASASDSAAVKPEAQGSSMKPEPDPNSQRILEMMRNKGPAS